MTLSVKERKRGLSVALGRPVCELCPFHPPLHVGAGPSVAANHRACLCCQHTGKRQTSLSGTFLNRKDVVNQCLEFGRPRLASTAAGPSPAKVGGGGAQTQNNRGNKF